MLKTKTKIMAMCVFGLMAVSSMGAMGANIGKNAINTTNGNTQPQPAGKAGVLLSHIGIKAHYNANTHVGGYSLAYALVTLGNHNVTYGVDYNVWHSSATHDYGYQKGMCKKLSLGPVLISLGQASYSWDEFKSGSFRASLLCDGNETDNDTDNYNGNFEADAGHGYQGLAGQPIQFNGAVVGGTGPYTWFWDFGDGSTSTELNPQHAYSATGNYTVIFTVNDATTNQQADDETFCNIV